MPRQGVPYPSREICSLKCQIDALNAKINELMKSINGVQGDGQGDLSLVSGDPAIVINNDQVQHEIEISLDSSQLPAAAVSSVNSQTGAVQLEADDIPSDGNSDVQADIDALKALGVNLQGAINNEITARGNADAALQGNINTVQASIPGEAANAVANDPTVIQLATDVPNKLDKITSGSSLKAYTHTGATQGEKSVVDGTTADSIAIRDANGRLQAADPASGATDKTLVTANWVSQTGDSAPNNLMHRNANETVDGIKNFLWPAVTENVLKDTVAADSSTWRRLYNIATSSSGSNRHVRIVMDGTRVCSHAVISIMWGGLSSAPTCYIETSSITNIDVRVCRATDGHIEVWTNAGVLAYVENEFIRTGGLQSIVRSALSPSDTTEPVVGADYLHVVTPQVI